MVVAVAIVVAVVLPRDPELREPQDVADLAARVDRAVAARVREGDAPTAAVAIVHGGRVAWSRGYGGARADTAFQVGSISKPVAAAALIRVAQDHHLSVDTPLTVRGWPAPAGMTLRRLLSHTAGLSVSGYLGRDPRLAVPSTLAEVTGRGDAPAVKVIKKPGDTIKYSGGGYAVAQLWAEQLTGERFDDLARKSTFAPLRMDDSSFAQDLDPDTSFYGHDARGRRVPAYKYAAEAAAGLTASADDIGRFVAFLMSGDPLARAMRRPAPATGGQWGMGVELRGLQGGRTLLEHEGVNRGWHARFVAEPRSGWGLVVLTDSDRGGAVADAATAELIQGV